MSLQPYTANPVARRLRPLVLLPFLLLAIPVAIADPAAPPAKPAPVHHARHRRHAHAAKTTPAPPAPVNPETAGTQPAPVPNEAVSDVPPGQAPDTRVTPSLLQLHYPHVGDGYVQGSSPSAIDDRNTARAPGVEMQVPLK